MITLDAGVNTPFCLGKDFNAKPSEAFQQLYFAKIQQSNIRHLYRPQRSWGKVMFSQACVILFTGGVCLSACWDTTPRTRHPLPQEQTPQGTPPPGVDPPEWTPWEQTSPPGADPPPPEQIPLPPPDTEHAGRYGQRAGGTHPTGMQSCFS